MVIDMLLIGSHTHYNSDTQLCGVVEEALSYTANSFMFYTGSPTSTNRVTINKNLTLKAHKLMDENNISINNVFVHAPYIINFANNSDARKYNFYISFLKSEIDRCKEYGVNNLIFHPGSYVDLDKKEAMENIINSIDLALNDKTDINLLKEFMSGKGSEMCSSIDEISYVFSKIENKDKVFVCLDTCHMNDSGVDLKKFDEFLDEFDKKIGIEKIKCVHVNDSHNFVGVKKDRHTNIGYGTIGFSVLNDIVHNKRLENIPKILETPTIKIGQLEGVSPYKYEIENFRNNKFKDFIKYNE